MRDSFIQHILCTVTVLDMEYKLEQNCKKNSGPLRRLKILRARGDGKTK